MSSECFVTLATNDPYAIGCLVLAHSIRNVGTSRHLCIMITKEVSPSIRSVLPSVFDHVEVVNVLDSGDDVNLALLNRPDLGCTFTKLHCWRLTQYKKCVFIDADCLVLKPIDELFERDELSAAPDLGWPDCFNSGVFVFVPSLETYNKLLNFALTSGSFDGADQGLLNSYFHDWSYADIRKHLPFIYNVTPSVFYTYKPALRKSFSDVKILHFLGPVKPWHTAYDRTTGTVMNMDAEQSYFYSLWWKVLYDRLYPSLGPVLERLGMVHQYKPSEIHDYSIIDFRYENARRAHIPFKPSEETNYISPSTFKFRSSSLSAIVLMNYDESIGSSLIQRTVYFDSTRAENIRRRSKSINYSNQNAFFTVQEISDLESHTHTDTVDEAVIANVAIQILCPYI